MMSGPDYFTPEMHAYFEKLPIWIQESLMQNAAPIESLTQLQQLAASLLANDIYGCDPQRP